MKQGYKLTLGIGVVVWAGGLPVAWGAEREYWIAAEKVAWNYAPSGKSLLHASDDMGVWGKDLVYQKYRYIQYTDGSFSHIVAQPIWMGILGPQLRAVEGDVLKVHFLNRADKPLSMHPHGMHYDEHNEGADRKGMGAAVPPGGTFTYQWQADAGASPALHDPSSIVWVYHSYVNNSKEIYEGLIGSVVVTRKGMERGRDDPRPKDVDVEFTALFMVFNENSREKAQEPKFEKREKKRRLRHEEDEHTSSLEEGNMKHSINGYIFGNLQGLTVKRGQRVRWHLIGMGEEESEDGIHSVHWHGATVLDHGKHTDVVDLMPNTMTSVDMLADNPGRWLFYCRIADHKAAGMATHWEVKP